MTTVFDIKTIQVMIYTNDPKNRKIELKGSIFGFDKVNAFFSDSALYSSEALNELTGYDPVEKRRIFFDPDLFYSFLELSRSKNPTDEQTINIRGCNFKTMIDALFVVSFPVPKKVELDYDDYNCIDSTPDFLVKNIRSFFQKNAYTHISSKDKKYTVLHAKWPNRIQTNPDYAASLVQALNIYKKGKEGFKNLKTDTVSKSIADLKTEIGDFKIDVDKDFHVFKSYTITGNGKIKDIVEKLNKNLEILQKDFYFYVYLWILYLSKIYSTPKESKSGGAKPKVTPKPKEKVEAKVEAKATATAKVTAKEEDEEDEEDEEELNQNVNNAYNKPKGKRVQIQVKPNPKINVSNYIPQPYINTDTAVPSYFYKTTVPRSTSGTKDASPGFFYTQSLNYLIKFSNWQTKSGNNGNPITTINSLFVPPSQQLSQNTTFGVLSKKQCVIDSNARKQILNDFENTNPPETVTKQLFVDKNWYKPDSNFVGFIIFLKKFLTLSEANKPSELDITISEDAVTKTTLFETIENIRNIAKLDILVCDYGFNEKTGLYHKIRDLIETIDFFKDVFNKTVDLNTPIDTVKEIIEEFKVKIVRVNEFLEKKDQIKTTSEIEKLLEELIKERKGIDSSDIVETSRFQNTKKARDPVWEKLYKEGWYKNFANSMLEITQLRRSSNNKINVALGESGQYIVSDLETLVNDNEEAGIDEINIGGNRSENLPSFGANIFCVLVGGEITDENRGAIRCPYSSNKIGSLLSRLWLKLPSNEDLRRTDFMDLTPAIKKAEQALKNKTQKKQNLKKEDGIRDLVKARGLDQYDDERLKQVLRKEGYDQGQGLFGNLFGQGDKPVAEAKVQTKVQAKVQAKVELSGDARQFIQENIVSIKKYDSTGLKGSSSFSTDNIIETDGEFIKYLTSNESDIIPILNEAIKISKETLLDEKQKSITKEINTKISKYDVTIKNSNINTTTKEYQDDETKKQKNYLDLYHATIMKNLLDAVIEELNTYISTPLERTGSNIVGSPRGNLKPGGSKKRLFKKSFRKTLRKAYRK